MPERRGEQAPVEAPPGQPAAGVPYRPGRRTLTAWLVGAVVVQGLVWLLLRSQGVGISGDAPHYLIASQSLGHFTVDVRAAYLANAHSQAVYTLPSGPGHTYLDGSEAWAGPHGLVFALGYGLPALLAPFTRLGGVPLALAALCGYLAVAWCYLHQRLSRFFGLGRAAQLCLVLCMAAPSVLIAGTQVYPDLLSGLLLAVALIELAFFERDGHLGRRGLVVVGAGLILLPWLHVKNLAPAAVVAGALALLGWRSGRRRPVAGVLGALGLGVLALLAFNQHYFGHLLGRPEGSFSPSFTTLVQFADLWVDRHQGVIVQDPVVLAGLVGCWLLRRRLPITVLATAVALLALLILNASITDPNFGGTSLAGRFEWSVVPVLCLGVAAVLADLATLPRRLGVLAVVVAGLWLVEGVPAVVGDHSYFSATQPPFLPWDPATYPGWWAGINQYLPDLLPGHLRSPGTWLRLAFEVALALALVAGLLLLRRGRRLPLGWAAGAGVGMAVALGLVALVTPAGPLPDGPATWTAASFGGPWAGGPRGLPTKAFRLLGLAPGRYRIAWSVAEPGQRGTVTAVLSRPERVVVSGWFTPSAPTDASYLHQRIPPPPPSAVVAHHTLQLPDGPSSTSSSTWTFTVPSAEWVAVRFDTPAHARLSFRSLSLTKLS